jgi:fructosamine-3-kinase
MQDADKSKRLNRVQIDVIQHEMDIDVFSHKYITSGAANDIFRIFTENSSFITKRSKADLPMLFQYEAEAINAIRETDTVFVPAVVYVNDDFLILEDLGDEHKEISDVDWYKFGSQIGCMHQTHFDYFGYPHDNYLGIWEQKNTPDECWIDFYYTNRVECYLFTGKNAELLTTEDRNGIRKIIQKMGELIPDQKPSLCHGDFWINNIYRKESGKIYLIDPAIHYGLPEADLAMTQMYAVFPDSFYDGYRSTHSLLDDWKDRLPLYQLKELILMIAQFAHEESLNTLRGIIKKYA